MGQVINGVKSLALWGGFWLLTKLDIAANLGLSGFGGLTLLILASYTIIAYGAYFGFRGIKKDKHALLAWVGLILNLLVFGGYTMGLASGLASG